MTPSSWTAEPYDLSASLRLQEQLGIGPAAAQVLARRGHTDVDEARAFLAADVRTHGADLPGAGAACQLILRHVAAGSRILVFGDYDVDGVSSTAMMVRTLRALGADPAWQLPDRAEGYGLNTDVVERIASFGTRLLITVDCGIASAAEVARARQLGLDVLVTDHHRPPADLPDCPVVHPALGPEGIEGPAGELCAAGVVLKLSEALRVAAGTDPAGAEEDLDLAGLATVCDMVPLRDENRRIAREGVAALGRTRKPGLRALMEVAALQPADVDARAVGFRLGPRINAAGRMQRADAALELLLTEDPERAAEIAAELDALNHDRRETEQRILWEAEAACAPQLAAGALVVAGEEWHAGVVGIVASRLVERFRRPAVVIALDGEGGGRGSARSIAAYDLHAGLASCAALLRRFGGHRMAAGLEIDADRVGELRAALAAHAGAALAPGDLRRTVRVDAAVPGGDLTLATADELERLGPFGAGNPVPKLLVPAARIEHVTAMGDERQHARFSLVNGGARARAVAFRRSQRSLAARGGTPQDAIVSLERNSYNGAVEPRLVLEAMADTPPGTVRDIGRKPFWTTLEEAFDEPLARLPRTGKGWREVSDRRGKGVAALCVEMLGTGADLLVAVSDVERRRGGLEQTLAGAAPGSRLDVVRWDSLMRNLSLAEPYPGVLAFDPPPGEAALPGPGVLCLGWGTAERDFTLASWRYELALRSRLADLWRAFGGSRVVGERALEQHAGGAGRFAGRALRIFHELGLVEVDRRNRSTTIGAGGKVALEDSETFTMLRRALTEIESALVPDNTTRAVA